MILSLSLSLSTLFALNKICTHSDVRTLPRVDREAINLLFVHVLYRPLELRRGRLHNRVVVHVSFVLFVCVVVGLFVVCAVG